MANAAKKEEALKTLSLRNITQFNVRGSQFIVNVSPDIEVEDLLKPTFWTHVVGSTFVGELPIVNVIWDDKSQFARLYVREYDHAYANMELLEHHDFRSKAGSSESVTAEPRFESKWTGPTTKYKILRIEDGNIMAEGLATKEAVAEALAKFEKEHR